MFDSIPTDWLIVALLGIAALVIVILLAGVVVELMFDEGFEESMLEEWRER